MGETVRVVVIGGGLLAYFAALLILDTSLWPGHNVPILYAVPLFVMALRQPISLVVSTVVLAILFDIAGIWLEKVPPTVWPLTLAALVGTGYGSILFALRQEEQRQRTRHQEERLHLVEQMRQPLTVILGYLQLLRLKADLSDQARHQLHRIEIAAQRLRSLVDELLVE